MGCNRSRWRSAGKKGKNGVEREAEGKRGKRQRERKGKGKWEKENMIKIKRG